MLKRFGRNEKNAYLCPKQTTRIHTSCLRNSCLHLLHFSQ